MLEFRRAPWEAGMLDLRTLLVAYSVTIVILSMALALAARSQRRFPGLELWSLGGLLVGTVPLQISMDGVAFGLPNPITCSVAILGGMACLSAGMARYTARPFRRQLYAGLALLWATYVILARTTSLSWTVGLVLAPLIVATIALETASHLLCRRHLMETPAHRVTALLFLAMCGGAISRAVTVVMFGPGGPHFGFAALHPLGLLGFQAFHTAMGASLLVMVWARLDRELQAHVGTLEEQLGRDPLTGALNRRGLRSGVEPLIEESRRYGMPISVICLDIDHFKRVNDSYGHGVGDEVLKALVDRVREHLRTSDHVARLGGEEFAIVLPGTPLSGAVALAERLRVAAADHELVLETARIHFTCSFGVAERLPNEDGLSAMLARADLALYEAKHAGRNQVREALVPTAERTPIPV